MPGEHQEGSAESHESPKLDLESARQEQLGQLHEAGGEQDPSLQAEKQAENSREAARKIIDRQETDQQVAGPEAETGAAPRGIAFLDHHLNYVQTLASIQRKLTPISRSFSKVIHTPIIEKTSEALETTVARPSVLVGTTWTALIVGTIFYLTAHHYGFALSGSELLFSFIVGAVVGLIIEGIWHLATRRSAR
jgi:hypothetical protein